MTTEPIVTNDSLLQENYLVRAGTWKRFANYIIDLILFYIFIFFLGFIVALVSPSTLDAIPDNPGFNLVDRIITLILYGFYMSIMEALFKGNTLGKVITKTRAVNLDGSTISVKTAFGRGFTKAVPFCGFSALGSPCIPWQDKWTDTMVIDIKESNIQA